MSCLLTPPGAPPRAHRFLKLPGQECPFPSPFSEFLPVKIRLTFALSSAPFPSTSINPPSRAPVSPTHLHQVQVQSTPAHRIPHLSSHWTDGDGVRRWALIRLQGSASERPSAVRGEMRLHLQLAESRSGLTVENVVVMVAG